MYQHWSNSKLADLIRGTTKPRSASASQWDKWRADAKNKSKFRFWLAEEGLDYLQDLVFFPSTFFNKILNHLNNRFILKTHSLTASKEFLERGSWHDLTGRFLPCLFSELVNFVEVECAWIGEISTEDKKKYNLPWWRKFGFYKNWRCKEAGIDYLKWSMSLIYNEDMGVSKFDPAYNTPTKQALDAKEILELYIWWTEIRPLRSDPYQDSEYEALTELLYEKYGSFNYLSRSPSEDKLISHSLSELTRLEELYEKEDEDMMIRLIKVRSALWT